MKINRQWSLLKKLTQTVGATFDVRNEPICNTLLMFYIIALQLSQKCAFYPLIDEPPYNHVEKLKSEVF